MSNWQEKGLNYNRYSQYLSDTFGEKIYGVSVDAGFTCPNIDGTVARGGCVYCNNNSFVPARRLPEKKIYEMIEAQVPRMKKRFGAKRFLVNFQAATNTYSKLETLRAYYEEALSHPDIFGIKISTRPDCLSEEVLDLLEEYSKKYYLVLEIGLQTIHEQTSKWINRAHDTECFYDAIRRAKKRNLRICTHVILGLKNETEDHMIETAKAIASIGIHGVKIHHLQVVKNTALAYQYKKGEIELLGRDATIEVTAKFLEHIPKDMVVYRVLGETPYDMLVAPVWNQNKQLFVEDLDSYMNLNNMKQGAKVL